jgi:hypothetical protein
MVGEINKALDGFHAQVATLRRQALIQRYQRASSLTSRQPMYKSMSILFFSGKRELY